MRKVKNELLNDEFIGKAPHDLCKIKTRSTTRIEL